MQFGSWLAERHAWETKNEWMLFHHGVVPAIASVIETFTENGDGILNHSAGLSAVFPNS